MWIEVIYSEGDLTSDCFLASTDYKYDSFTPRFMDEDDVKYRIDHIDDMIHRLDEERKYLENCGNSLVGKYSYDDLP